MKVLHKGGTSRVSAEREAADVEEQLMQFCTRSGVLNLVPYRSKLRTLVNALATPELRAQLRGGKLTPYVRAPQPRIFVTLIFWSELFLG